RTVKLVSGGRRRAVTPRRTQDAAPVSCSGWILMKALICEDGGGTQPPPFAPPNRRPSCAASSPPPTPDSMPGWTCTPGPSSSPSSTAMATSDYLVYPSLIRPRFLSLLIVRQDLLEARVGADRVQVGIGPGVEELPVAVLEGLLQGRQGLVAVA